MAKHNSGVITFGHVRLGFVNIVEVFVAWIATDKSGEADGIERF